MPCGVPKGAKNGEKIPRGFPGNRRLDARNRAARPSRGTARALRRIGPRLDTPNFKDKAQATIRRGLWPVVAGYWHRRGRQALTAAFAFCAFAGLLRRRRYHPLDEFVANADQGELRGLQALAHVDELDRVLLEQRLRTCQIIPEL